jgi:hypothetical protein
MTQGEKDRSVEDEKEFFDGDGDQDAGGGMDLS